MSHSMRSWLSAAALTVAALSGASCKKPATGLRVLVTTDFSPSSTTPPLHSVLVRVSDVRTGAELIADTINVLDGAATLPLKFSVFLTTAASDRVRIADRGLREGILVELMHADGAWAEGGRS